MKKFLLMLIAVSGCDLPAEKMAECEAPKTQGPAQESNGIEVHLEPEKENYLIGEPVMLTLSLKNNSQEEIKAWSGALKDEVQIYLFGNGYQRYIARRGIAVDVKESTEILPPGETRTYRYKVFYSHGYKEPEQNKLAFPIPGTYCIQMKYPLFPDRKMLKSELVHIIVQKPTGNDAKIWKKLNDPSVLRFLQFVELGADEEDIPVELATLLERFPESGYADGLKQALRVYYQKQASSMYPETAFTDPWMQKLRKLVDIEMADPRLFPDDRRLDVKIQYHYPEVTPWADVFSNVSKQSGVTLKLDPSLKIRTSKSLSVTTTLREFMRNKSAYQAKWIKDGDDYMLLYDPPTDEKPGR